jgi:hypothetical protein
LIGDSEGKITIPGTNVISYNDVRNTAYADKLTDLVDVENPSENENYFGEGNLFNIIQSSTESVICEGPTCDQLDSDLLSMIQLTNESIELSMLGFNQHTLLSSLLEAQSLTADSGKFIF